MRIRSFLALSFALLVIMMSQTTVVSATGGVISVTQDGCDFTFTITPSEPYGWLNLTVWDQSQPVDFSQDFQTSNTQPIVFNRTIASGEQWEYVFWDRGAAQDEYLLIERAYISCTAAPDDDQGTPDDDQGTPDDDLVNEDDADEEDEPVSKAGPPFEPGDARINRQAGAPVAVYCDSVNSLLTIYAIGPDGHGTRVGGVPYDDFDSTPPLTGQVIWAQWNITVLQTVQGAWMVRVLQSDGKVYEFSFSACPYANDGVAVVY